MHACLKKQPCGLLLGFQALLTQYQRARDYGLSIGTGLEANEISTIETTGLAADEIPEEGITCSICLADMEAGDGKTTRDWWKRAWNHFSLLILTICFFRNRSTAHSM